MDRRGFIGGMAALTTVLSTGFTHHASQEHDEFAFKNINSSLDADVVIVGGGLGGFAAALASLRQGQKVILTEVTDWIGGQLTQQGVPPDEHHFIESHGAPVSYRRFRDEVRKYYKEYYPLTEHAKAQTYLNPGDGAVSRLCHEPRVALAVLENMIAPYISSGLLTLLLQHEAISAKVEGNIVNAVLVKDLLKGEIKELKAPYFVDATELGDLLPLTGTEYSTGIESKAETGELHAPTQGNPKDAQAFTMVMALDYVANEDHRIPKPKDYDFWVNYIPKIQPAWPGKLLSLTYSNPQTLEPRTLGFDPTGKPTGDVLNLWNYRRIINKDNFTPHFYSGDISIINWPQNDYMLGNLIDAPKKEWKKHVDAAKQLSLSLLYWLQTEVPRADGGKGWPGLRLRKDILGTADGLAKYPYIRESRRIKAVFTIKEEHVGKENRKQVAKAGEDPEKAAYFYDSVGVGYYPIDLHPTMKGNYIDFPALLFQIPLGALLPVRMENILPANKNIGTTHITNGCYRLHPVEWGIGEAVGSLIYFAKKNNVKTRTVREKEDLLKSFQSFLHEQGIETNWK